MRARILHLVTTLDRGGAESALLELLPRLDRDRFEIEIVWLKGPGELADEFRESGIPARGLGMLGSWDVSAMLRAATHARRRRPDLIHTHLFKADVAGAHAARSARCGLISTKHNEDPQLTNPVVRALGSRVAAGADRVIAISEAVRLHVLRNLPALPTERVRVVRYGIDLDELDVRPDAPDLRAALGLPAEAPLLMFAGRLVPQKSLEVLVSAMVRIRQVAPAAHLVVAGRGPQEAAIRERVRALGLESTVRFLGFRPDAPVLFRQADLVLLPSRWEGLGRVLLEAMAAGRCAVASRVGAIPEVIADGETGRLVAPDDPDAITDVVLPLLADRALRERMGRQGRTRVENRFRIEDEVAATEATYDEVLAARRKPPRTRRTRKRRVLLVSRPGTGGAARHVSLLAETLDLDRFELHAAVSSREDPAFPERLRAAGAAVDVLDLDRAVAPGPDLAAVRRLLEIVRRVRPDVIHAHASKAGAIARIAGTIAGVPTLYSPHGWAFGYVGNGPVGSAAVLGTERLLRFLGRGVVCVSPAEAEAARRHGLARRDRLHLVPNAVDAGEFQDLPDRDEVRKRLGLPLDARVALMVARLAEPKDPLTFVRAAAFLPLGEPLHRMLLVGDGPLLEACLDLALESGVGDTLVCPGAIHDMPALLAAADVLVLSTRYEGLPYVLLEGLAAGIPVVASDIPGCRALLAGGRGRLVPPGDAPAMARAIEAALADETPPPGLPPEVDLDAWIARIEEIYEETAPRPRA